MKNYSTPNDQILFRASKVGLLASGLAKQGLTETQKSDLDDLELKLIAPEGISAKQLEDLNTWKKKRSDGKPLTDAQREKIEIYEKRLITPKPLSATRQQKIEDLRDKENRPPELSDGAKTYVRETWLENEKGFRKEIHSKYLQKGTESEEDAISLISLVDRRMYTNNKTRITKGHLTGEIDVRHTENIEVSGMAESVKIIDDTKCSYDPETFMNAVLTSIYEWQGRAYLYLEDADIFRLRYCLVNMAPAQFNEQWRKFTMYNGIIDESLPEYTKIAEQFIKNRIFDFETAMKNQFDMSAEKYDDIVFRILPTLEPKFSPGERVKTFLVERDYEKEEILIQSTELGVEYYKTITLNQGSVINHN